MERRNDEKGFHAEKNETKWKIDIQKIIENNQKFILSIFIEKEKKNWMESVDWQVRGEATKNYSDSRSIFDPFFLKITRIHRMAVA